MSAGSSGKPVEGLIRDLGSSNERVRIGAARELSEQPDPRAADALIKALGDRHPAVRSRAVLALGRLVETRALRSLIALMGDADSRVRASAAGALKRFGRQAYRPVLEAYRTGGLELRHGALGVLGRFKSSTVSELLIAALDNPERKLRWEATRVLARRKDKLAVERLIAAALDERAEEKVGRLLYVWALGEIGDRRAFEPLQGLLNDADFNIQRAAVTAMRRIDNASAVDHIYERLGEATEDERGQLEHRLAEMDLMNATESFRRKVPPGFAGIPQLFAAVLEARKALKAVVRENRGLSPAPSMEQRTERLRKVESVIRALGRGEPPAS
jgi:HEAT repeat protein